jgi:hypothetical protein
LLRARHDDSFSAGGKARSVGEKPACASGLLYSVSASLLSFANDILRRKILIGAAWMGTAAYV